MNPQIVKMAVILGLMSIIGPFSIDMYLPALPAIAADLQASEQVIQFTLTVYFFAFATAQIFYGPAADMFGRKAPIYVGLAIFIGGSLGCALAPDAQTLIIYRFLQGLGAAGVMSVPRAIIRDQFTGAEATRLMSSIMLVIAVSPMLAPLAGSFIIEPFGWRPVFLAVLLTGVVALLVNFLFLPETLPVEKRVPFRFGEMLSAFATLLRDVNFVGLILIGGLGMATIFSYLGSASFIYIEHFGLTERQFAIAFASSAIGFFLASQFAANIMRAFGAATLIRGATFGYALTNVALFAVFMSGMGNLWVLVLMVGMANLFLGVIMPTAMVLSLEDHGPIAGAAASLGGTVQMMVAALAMTLSGALFDGTPFPMLAIMAVSATGTLVLALLTVRSPALASSG